MSENLTVLVAGGAGFIGTNFCGRLLKEGFKVICLDNFVTSSKSNIEQYLANLNFQFIEFDISRGIPVLEADQKVDYIVNLACPASPIDYQNLPIETLEVCSQGTKNLLELAASNRARFIHASTSEVYGDPDVHPQPETYWGRVNSYGPRSCYDEGKRYAESLIWVYRRKRNVNTGVFRIFNTYGPFMRPRDGRVITNFVRQALSGENITVYGEGAQTRSFCYVDDLVDGILRFMKSDEEGPINLGNPGEFTIRQLAEMVIRLTDTKSQMVQSPMPADDPRQRKPDITRAQQKLNWQPVVPLEEGLKKTIEWIRSERISNY